MRTLHAFVFVLFCTIGTLSAQEFDQRLLAGFTVEELETMKAENPDELAFWEFYADNGYELTDFPKGKEGDAAKFQTISVKNWSGFNVFKYIDRNAGHRQYFTVSDSGKLLIIRSISETKRLMNNEK